MKHLIPFSGTRIRYDHLKSESCFTEFDHMIFVVGDFCVDFTPKSLLTTFRPNLLRSPVMKISRMSQDRFLEIRECPRSSHDITFSLIMSRLQLLSTSITRTEWEFTAVRCNLPSSHSHVLYLSVRLINSLTSSLNRVRCLLKRRVHLRWTPYRTSAYMKWKTFILIQGTRIILTFSLNFETFSIVFDNDMKQTDASSCIVCRLFFSIVTASQIENGSFTRIECPVLQRQRKHYIQFCSVRTVQSRGDSDSMYKLIAGLCSNKWTGIGSLGREGLWVGFCDCCNVSSESGATSAASNALSGDNSSIWTKNLGPDYSSAPCHPWHDASFDEPSYHWQLLKHLARTGWETSTDPRQTAMLPGWWTLHLVYVTRTSGTRAGTTSTHETCERVHHT